MAGSGRATMRDVAALAGVSVKTVSNVVTGAVPVKEQTRLRVEAAMAKLDFVPNLSARGLRNGRTGMIAVALPFLATAFSSELLHRLVESAHARGLAVQIEETAAEPARERELLSRARAHLVDGLILNPIRIEDSVVAHAARLPPVVLIGEVEQPQTDHVGIDSTAAAAEVTRHVLAQGATRIAVIGADDEGTFPTATSRSRLLGVHRALDEAGIAPRRRLAINVPDWTVTGGAAAAAELLSRGEAFDAVICFTDSLAEGALHTLREHGVRVPHDVLVTGFDDVEPSRFAAPPLTTISIDRIAFADAAIRLLVQRIADRSAPPRSIVTPHRLVERESTAARPAGFRARD